MGERQSVVTVLGDETPHVQAHRGMREAVLVLAAALGPEVVIDTRKAIGLTGSIDFDVNTGRMVIRTERK